MYCGVHHSSGWARILKRDLASDELRRVTVPIWFLDRRCITYSTFQRLQRSRTALWQLATSGLPSFRKGSVLSSCTTCRKMNMPRWYSSSRTRSGMGDIHCLWQSVHADIATGGSSYPYFLPFLVFSWLHSLEFRTVEQVEQVLGPCLMSMMLESCLWGFAEEWVSVKHICHGTEEHSLDFDQIV